MALYCKKCIRSNNKNTGNFYYLRYLDYLRTKTKLYTVKKVCENKDFCNVVMPSEDTKISELNQYQKSDKAPVITYAHLESLIEKNWWV